MDASGRLYARRIGAGRPGRCASPASRWSGARSKCAVLAGRSEPRPPRRAGVAGSLPSAGQGAGAVSRRGGVRLGRGRPRNRGAARAASTGRRQPADLAARHPAKNLEARTAPGEREKRSPRTPTVHSGRFHAPTVGPEQAPNGEFGRHAATRDSGAVDISGFRHMQSLRRSAAPKLCWAPAAQDGCGAATRRRRGRRQPQLELAGSRKQGPNRRTLRRAATGSCAKRLENPRRQVRANCDGSLICRRARRLVVALLPGSVG